MNKCDWVERLLNDLLPSPPFLPMTGTVPFAAVNNHRLHNTVRQTDCCVELKPNICSFAARIWKNEFGRDYNCNHALYDSFNYLKYVLSSYMTEAFSLNLLVH